jgi:hypothetical protein
MTPQVYRKIQAETPAEVNPWRVQDNVIVSLDIAKRDDTLDEILRAGWSLVILDEAHLCANGATQRGSLARRIWQSDTVGVAIASATTGTDVTWLTDDGRTRVVSWALTQLRDWDGAPLWPNSVWEIVQYELSEPEEQIESILFERVQEVRRLREALLPVVTTFKRWFSSPYALEQTLRRQLTGRDTAFVPNESLTDDDNPAEEAPALEQPSLAEELCQQLLELLETAPADSKWVACQHVLRQLGVGSERPVILFTEFVDTAEYVRSLAESEGIPAWVLTGATPLDRRLAAVEEAERKRGVLITTTATEGIRYPSTEHVIHYDIPWNPRMLLTRIERVERLGRRFPAIHHHCFVSKFTETLLHGTLNKLKRIEQELGELDALGVDDFPMGM